MGDDNTDPNPWWEFVAPYETLYRQALSGSFAGVARHNVTTRSASELSLILRAASGAFATTPRHGRALDVGCGAGFICRAAADLGFVSMGIDLSPAAIELARSIHPSIRFEVMDGANPSFAPGETFDLIVIRAFHPFMRSSDSGLHMRLLSKYLGFLAPGGILAVTNPDAPERLDGPAVAVELRRAGWQVHGPFYPFLSLRLPSPFSSGPLLKASSAASRLVSTVLRLGLPWTMLVAGPRPTPNFLTPHHPLKEAA